MKTNKILWVIVIAIAVFLLYKIIRRYFIQAQIYGGGGMTTSNVASNQRTMNPNMVQLRNISKGFHPLTPSQSINLEYIIPAV